MKYILVSILSLFLFTACSSKKYFEPEDTSDNLNAKEESLSTSIKSMNRIGATLEDGKVITTNGVSKFELPENFVFLNASNDGKILATNYKDKILVGNDEIEINDVVVAASLKENKLALIYSNNTIELMDLNTKKTLFKEYSTASLANDTRISNPQFMGNLILFPTLNGKVVIISSITNKSVRNIAVDPQGQFNNIIYLNVIKSNQTLIVASPNKVVSISPREILAKDYELRDIIVKDENVYLATIDGQIIKLNSQLEELAKKKYRYSKIHALAFTDSLYAVESQGYLININKDFSKDVIYDFDFDNEERLIVIDNKIYYDKNIITLP